MASSEHNLNFIGSVEGTQERESERTNEQSQGESERTNERSEVCEQELVDGGKLKTDPRQSIVFSAARVR